jgi:hypothetical protein
MLGLATLIEAIAHELSLETTSACPIAIWDVPQGGLTTLLMPAEVTNVTKHDFVALRI